MSLKNIAVWNLNDENKTATACGTACGAGEKKPTEEKPAACGTACGASEK